MLVVPHFGHDEELPPAPLLDEVPHALPDLILVLVHGCAVDMPVAQLDGLPAQHSMVWASDWGGDEIGVILQLTWDSPVATLGMLDQGGAFDLMVAKLVCLPDQQTAVSKSEDALTPGMYWRPVS